MANLVLYKSTSSSLQVYIENLEYEYWVNYGTDNLPRHTQYTITVNGKTKIVTKDEDNEGETHSATFTGLDSDTNYEVIAVVYYYTPDGTNLSSTFSDTFATDEDPRPSNFAWDTPKVQGEAFGVTASEWNRLIDKVKEFHEYVHGAYNSTGYPMEYVEQGDIFYAERFNEVRYAIGSLYSTGIQDKVSGDPITAADLNKIVDSLNSIS